MQRNLTFRRDSSEREQVGFFGHAGSLSYGGPIVLCPSTERRPGDLWPSVTVG